MMGIKFLIVLGLLVLAGSRTEGLPSMEYARGESRASHQKRQLFQKLDLGSAVADGQHARPGNVVL